MISVFALCTCSIELDRASMLSDLAPGQPWTVPVLSFLVDHPRGRLLFDTGVHCQARLDPVGRLGPERVKRLTVKSKEGDDAVPQLARLGLKPDDVRYVANSHLHFDHCGGNEFFPRELDRKSTRLNSSHSQISYAVFCLKKKTNSTLNYGRLV